VTIQDLARAFRRHAWVVIAVLLVAAPVFLWVLRTPPLYTSRLYVYVLQPASPREPNALGATRSSVIKTAGVIERVVQGTPSALVVSDDVSILDMGITEGTLVRLPNAGGQWANDFNTPALLVEAVDRTPELVEARMERAIEEIDVSLARLQADSGASLDYWMTTQQSDIITVVPATGSEKRALAYLGVLVAGGVLVGVTAAEVRSLGRPPRRFFRAARGRHA